MLNPAKIKTLMDKSKNQDQKKVENAIQKKFHSNKQKIIIMKMRTKKKIAKMMMKIMKKKKK